MYCQARSVEVLAGILIHNGFEGKTYDLAQLWTEIVHTWQRATLLRLLQLDELEESVVQRFVVQIRIIPLRYFLRLVLVTEFNHEFAEYIDDIIICF